MASIAFFSKLLPSDSPNGVSVQVHRLAQALVVRGHDVTCFSFSPKPVDALYHHTKIEWKVRSTLLKKVFPAIAFRSLPTSIFDIVHYHGDDYLCAGSKKRVRTFYGSALQEALHAANARRFCYQALFYLFEWISCLKKGQLTAISKATHRSLPLVSNVIPCGVPLEKYTISNCKSQTPSILFLGDLDSRKRGHLLLDIFSRIIRLSIPNATITVIGPQPCSGSGIRYISNCSEDLLVKEYGKAWVYCMASSYEGFGVPAIEAFACGTAVVATNNPGILEFVTHGVNGMICTPETLGSTIIEVIENKALRESLICEGRKSARRYAMDQIAQEYEKLYGL